MSRKGSRAGPDVYPRGYYDVMRFLTFMNTPTGRGIRIVAGFALLALGLVLGGGAGVALALFAILPIATGVFGICPVNPLFGQPMRACSVPRKHRVPNV